ncbi:hypothetical protein [Faunimonas pinastri]|uniref:hypothetical protein n=1 Tax=Faunimonas pinastri TaxID=1855383 RepID=UPI0015A6555A|nr:hypothetical protein [Faunimonas pinastri]
MVLAARLVLLGRRGGLVLLVSGRGLLMLARLGSCIGSRLGRRLGCVLLAGRGRRIVLAVTLLSLVLVLALTLSRGCLFATLLRLGLVGGLRLLVVLTSLGLGFAATCRSALVAGSRALLARGAALGLITPLMTVVLLFASVCTLAASTLAASTLTGFTLASRILSALLILAMTMALALLILILIAARICLGYNDLSGRGGGCLAGVSDASKSQRQHGAGQQQRT